MCQFIVSRFFSFFYQLSTKQNGRVVSGSLLKSQTISYIQGLSQRNTNIVPSSKARKASKASIPTELPTPMDVDADASVKSSKPELPPGVDDIDAQDGGDPQLVTDYVYEVDAYMKKLEVHYNLLYHAHTTCIDQFHARIEPMSPRCPSSLNIAFRCSANNRWQSTTWSECRTT